LSSQGGFFSSSTFSGGEAGADLAAKMTICASMLEELIMGSEGRRASMSMAIAAAVREMPSAGTGVVDRHEKEEPGETEVVARQKAPTAEAPQTEPAAQSAVASQPPTQAPAAAAATAATAATAALRGGEAGREEEPRRDTLVLRREEECAADLEGEC